MESINSLREEIDAIDGKILDLIRKRAKTSIKIGQIKKLSKSPIVNKKREKEITKKLKNAYEIQIFRKIISESRKIQKTPFDLSDSK